MAAKTNRFLVLEDDVTTTKTPTIDVVFTVPDLSPTERRALNQRRLPQCDYKRLTYINSKVYPPYGQNGNSLIETTLRSIAKRMHASTLVREQVKQGENSFLDKSEVAALTGGSFEEWVSGTLRLGPEAYRVVEVGINQDGHLCNFGVCMRAPSTTNNGADSIEKTTDRILFVSIGIDGGIKRFFIAPTFRRYRRWGAPSKRTRPAAEQPLPSLPPNATIADFLPRQVRGYPLARR